MKYWSILICLAVFAFISLVTGKTQIMEGESMAARVEGSVVNPQYNKGKNRFRVDRISLESGALLIDSGDNRLKVKMISDDGDITLNDISFTDGEGKQISAETNLLEGTHLTGKYEAVRVNIMDRILSIDLGYKDPLEFACYDGKLRYVSFNGDFLDAIPQPEMTSLEFLYPLFTGRGYIWVSSIPLAEKCILLGKGIGSFPFSFPQSEVAGMLNVHGSADYCIEIAHSWYLQTAVSSGAISLLCMLGLFFIHFAGGVKAYWKKAEKDDAVPGKVKDIGMGFFFGILAFQIAGIVNNSTVATGPEFWLLLGTSMGFLYHVRNCSNRSNGLKVKKF